MKRTSLIDVLQDALSLIIETDVPTSAIAAWTTAERREVDRWARAVYLNASDNHNRVPPTPGVLIRGGWVKP